MPKQNQMLGLMQMAWDRCHDDIHDFIGMLFGAAVFFAVWFAFTIRSYAGMLASVNFELPDGAIDTSTALLGSGVCGFINACSILFFMFIIVCLADYTVTFVTLCYHYDNESWEVVKLLIRINESVTNWFRRDAEKTKIKQAERLAEIRAGISKIKADDEL